MRNYNLERAILDLEESLLHEQPFDFKFQRGLVEFQLSPSKVDEFNDKKAVIKQKAAKEMLELLKSYL